MPFDPIPPARDGAVAPTFALRNRILQEVHAEEAIDAVNRKLVRVDPKVVESEPERLEVSHTEPVALLGYRVGGANTRDRVSVTRAVTETVENLGEDQRHGRASVERELPVARSIRPVQSRPHDDNALIISFELGDRHGMNHGR